MNLICNSPKCNGNTILYILIDGYPVGDRLLEGVLFQVSFDNKNKIKVEIEPSCYEYFESLNKSKWYKAIEGIFESMIDDKDFSWASCCECGEEEYLDVVGAKAKPSSKKSKSLVVQVKSINDILKKK
jgi:hypothetical protein